jgi:hypothetical protein
MEPPDRLLIAASPGAPNPYSGQSPPLPTRHRHRHRLDLLPYATYSSCPPWALRCRGRPLRPDFGQRLPPANPFRLAIERNIFAEHPPLCRTPPSLQNTLLQNFPATPSDNRLPVGRRVGGFAGDARRVPNAIVESLATSVDSLAT